MWRYAQVPWVLGTARLWRRFVKTKTFSMQLADPAELEIMMVTVVLVLICTAGKEAKNLEVGFEEVTTAVKAHGNGW